MDRFVRKPVFGRGVLAAALFLTMAAPARAAGDAREATGIVAEYCVDCHVVPGLEPQYERAMLGAPAFQSIADRPWTYTDRRLRTFLSRPHFPMRQLMLSPSDIDNLMAFIAGLRQPQGR
jgi:hypothetical protein